MQGYSHSLSFLFRSEGEKEGVEIFYSETRAQSVS